MDALTTEGNGDKGQADRSIWSQEKRVPHLRWSQAPPLPWRRPWSADNCIYIYIYMYIIGNKICEYVACKSCSNIMSHFDSIEIDIYPCDDEDIDEQIQIYVDILLVNEFPDDNMNLILNEKDMRHYQDYGQGLKHVVTIHILLLHSAC